ncbi:MAG: hypothetical protein ACYTHJ_11550 [Planctomycetota bacterium]|jgi:hypothetical protein
MKCPDDDTIVMLSVGPDDEALTRQWSEHVDGCSRCKDRLAAARRDHVALVRSYEAHDRDHDARREQLLASLPARDVRFAQARRSAMGEFWMNHKKAAYRVGIPVVSAACLVFVLAALIGLSGERALAAAIASLREVNTISCRISTSVVGGMLPVNTEGRMYLSTNHGTRVNMFMGEQLISEVYHPVGEDAIVVTPAAQTYFRLSLDGISDMEMIRHKPDLWLKRLRELGDDADRELGERTINGVEAVGFEISGHRLGLGGSEDDDEKALHGIQVKSDEMIDDAVGRLWVDVETWRPMIFVIEMPGPMPGTRIQFTHDQFKWDEVLDPEMFVPQIPAGFREINIAVPAADEEGLINGLRLFAKLSGGDYPASLELSRFHAEIAALVAENVVKNFHAPSKNDDSENDKVKVDGNDPFMEALTQEMLDISTAARFFQSLVTEGASPEYFGESVSPEDADAILLRWVLPSGASRVVHGDLTVETVE